MSPCNCGKCGGALCRSCCEDEDAEWDADDDGEPDFTVDPNDPTHPGWQA